MEFLTRKTTDTLKGLAIVLVVMGHIATNWVHEAVALGGIGVSIFFILSGFGLQESWKKNGVNNFVKKKLLRIILPYVIWIVLYHIVVRLSPLSVDSPPYSIIPRHFYWFIECLIYWYFMFWAAHRFAEKYFLWILFSAAVLSFFCFNKTSAEQSLSFVLGCVISTHIQSFKFFKNKTYWQVTMFSFVGGKRARPAFVSIKNIPIRIVAIDSHSLDNEIIIGNINNFSFQ